MKKAAVILIFLLCFLLAGCGDDNPETDSFNQLNDSYAQMVESAKESFTELPPDIWAGKISMQPDSDAEYDLYSLAESHGHVVICLKDHYLSNERAAVLLLEVKNIFDEAKIPFHTIDFMLTLSNEESYIRLVDFPYSEIYEEGFAERIEAASVE